MKKGTTVKHGRSVIFYNDGRIEDGYYFDNYRHGPQLRILPGGVYLIQEYEDGQRKSFNWYNVDDTIIK